MNKAIIVVAVAALVITGCNAANNQPVGTEKAQDGSPPAPTVQTKEVQKKEEKKNTSVKVGETATFEDSSTLTVHSLQPFQATNQFNQPKPGNRHVAADVEGCAGPKRQSAMNPFFFQIQLSDNTRESAGATFGGAEPQLDHVDLLDSDCVRGWVTFEIPNDKDPTYITFSDFQRSAKFKV